MKGLHPQFPDGRPRPQNQRYSFAQCWEQPHIHFGGKLRCPHADKCGWEQEK